MSQKRLQVLQQALALHKAGQLAPAMEVYRGLIARHPQDFDANLYLGMALTQQKETDQAIVHLRAAVAANGRSALAQCNLGVALLTAGQAEAALPALDAAIAIKPDFIEAQAKRALALYRVGRLEDALAAYDHVLARKPDAGLLNDKGCVLRDLGRHDDAVSVFTQVLALRPHDIATRMNLAHAQYDAQDYNSAGESYGAVLQADSRNRDAQKGLLLSLKAAGHDDRLEHVITDILQDDPHNAVALLDLGHMLRRKKRFAEAIDVYARAAAADSANPENFFYWGMLLYDLGRYDAAAEAYSHCITLQPDNGAAYQGRAEALRRLGRAEEALVDYDRAVALLPKDSTMAITALHAQMKVCDWRGYGRVADLMARLREDDKAVLLPFPLVALPVTAQDQLLAAQRYVGNRYDTHAQVWAKPDYGHGRIRVVYVSADFHKHATLVLMAGMFEAHDKNRFEIIAVSLGRDDGSALRRRVVDAVDEFVDAQRMSDEEIIALLHARECDIIVDLKGFTMDGREGLFTGRHAPVQVAYIGYPGTCALPNIDYFIGDHVVIPPELVPFFSEKIVALPHSYQVNDSRRAVPTDIPLRADLGLPEDAFVYCSFNNSYKFTPETFAVWMRILSRVTGSVLWLLGDNELMKTNLRAAAAAQGVDPARLVFAPMVELDAHVARLGRADLFLDSLPCNAHTTASDALWAGLPVLTCPGHTFAGRVAASLLTSVDMPELIVQDMAAYEDMAVALGHDRARCAQLHTDLISRRTTAPLFDTVRTTRDIERAYEEMMRRFRAGLAPDHIDVRSL